MAKNLNELPNAKHCSYYRSHVKMDYNINEHGFRSDSFYENKEINVVTIGCSNALGWGIPIQDRFSSIFCNTLAKTTNKTVADWNLGLPGKSNDYITRMTWISQKLLKPDVVLISFSGISRREYWDCTGRCVDYVPSNYPKFVKDKLPEEAHIHKKLHLLQSEWDNVNNCIRNFSTIQFLLKDTPWYFTFSSGEELGGTTGQTIEPLIPQEKYVGYFHKVDKAEDGMHPGILSNKDLAKRFLERYLDEFVKQPHVERTNEVIRHL